MSMRMYQQNLTREASLFSSRFLRQMRLRHPKAKGASEHVNENVLYQIRTGGSGYLPLLEHQFASLAQALRAVLLLQPVITFE